MGDTQRDGDRDLQRDKDSEDKRNRAIESNSDCASERKQKEKYWEIEIDGRRSTSRGRGEGRFYVMEIEYIGRKEEGLK